MRTINVFILFMIMEFVNAGSFVVQTESLKKAIVTISVSQSINIGFSEAKTSQGTGFIVDKVGRIIATNKHLAGSAPCNIKIKFWDGKTTKGKIIYVDPYDDFSLIQYSEKLNYPELYLGDFYSQKEGQEVHLIGTNDGEEYSYKKGVIVHLRKEQDIQSEAFQTSFDRTNGSSGSPVFNNKKEVIGIHFSGNNTTSFELPINYIKAKLDQWKNNKVFVRGHLPVGMTKVSIYDAEKYLQLSKTILKEMSDKKVRDLIMIDWVHLDMKKKLKAGDLILKWKNKSIGDDLYRLKSLIDKSVGKDVTLEIFRNGMLREVKVHVSAANTSPTTDYFIFQGATFHLLSLDEGLLFTTLEKENIILSQATSGTPFSEVGESLKNSTKIVVIKSVNGIVFDDIKKLKEYLNNYQKNHLQVVFRDLYSGTNDQIEFIDLN